MTEDTIQWIFDLILPGSLGIVMLVMMVVRYYQLKGSAYHSDKYNFYLKLRVAMLIVVISFTIGMMFLTLYDVNFWVNIRNKNWASIFVFESLVMLAQIFCLLYEYSKHVPLMWLHKFYWLVYLIVDCAELGVVIYDVIQDSGSVKPDAFELVVEAGRTISLLVLVSYSVWRPQDIFEYRNVPCFTLSVPGIKSEEQPLLPMPSMNNHKDTQTFEPYYIRVRIDKQFKVEEADAEEYQCILKLKVALVRVNERYVIKKTFKDFLDLESDLLTEAQNVSANQLFAYPFHIPDDSNKMSFTGAIRESDMIHKVSTLEQYLSTITSKLEYLLPPLLKFLQIPPQYQQVIEADRNKVTVIEMQIFQGLNRTLEEDSFANQQRENNNVFKKTSKMNVIEEEKREIEIARALDSEYLTYFDIQIIKQNETEDHIEYEIEVKVLLNEEPIKWTILKRYNDFKQLDQVLKSELKIQRLPPLPKRRLNKFQLDSKEQILRREGLENYLKTLLNEKIYFGKSLFDFIEFDATRSQNFKFSNISENIDISGFRAMSIGTSEMIDNKTQFTVYRFSIEFPQEDFKGEIIFISHRVIQKRFTDFEHLHSALKVHFQSQELPDLPPKFTAFGTNTTISQREQGFTTYLNQLFKIPKILECLHFKRFIELHTVSKSMSRGQVEEVVRFAPPELNQNTVDRPTSDLIQSLERTNELNEANLENLGTMYSHKNLSPHDRNRYNQAYS